VLAPVAGNVAVGIFVTSSAAACVARFDQSRMIVQGPAGSINLDANGPVTVSAGASQLAGGATLTFGGAVLHCINSWNAADTALNPSCN
jgi:hypothetical protein